jgi:hypothetical protein
LNTDFSRNDWKQLTDYPILEPEYPWEKKCVEGASIIERGAELFMFYAGGYNNEPQQIGIAKSKDGIHWIKLSESPFLSNECPENGIPVNQAIHISLKIPMEEPTCFFRATTMGTKHGSFPRLRSGGTIRGPIS